ncbi:MAG TPA: hypothetical protein VGM51_03725 [Armatimonadota bacterium]
MDRRQLEELLGVSKTVAWRLLRHCGAEPGPGNTLICRRPALIARLEELLAEGGRLDHEIRRHDRLAVFLETIRPQVLDAVSSPTTKKMYAQALDDFFVWRAGQAGLCAGQRAGPSRLAGGAGLRPSTTN